VAPYRERVYATALRLLGNRDDALEVTQEAFLRTFWKIADFHGRAHFYTWLYRVALNLCYRRLEMRKREPPAPTAASGSPHEAPQPFELPVDPSESPREAAAHQEAAALVRRALGHLSPEDFQILVLREFEELSYDELSRRLHVPKGTIMSRLHRARLALAEQFTRLDRHRS
jgi:RNA polymerase sigma-70 factor (ECF subfamily)